jgi:nicotinamide-nucleotide amidase
MSMESSQLSQQLGEALLEKGWKLACAESCTGGGIAAAITEVAGSSQWFDRGFVTYSNQAKQDMLGVAKETLGNYGAVSEQTVREMVTGAMSRSGAQVSVAVSGIAGPGGGSAEKPVGTVYVAWQVESQEPVVRTEHFTGDRASIREQTIVSALQGLLDVVGQN